MAFTTKYAYRTTSVKIKPSDTMPVENNFPTSKQIECNNFIVVLPHFKPVFTFISIPPVFYNICNIIMGDIGMKRTINLKGFNLQVGNPCITKSHNKS